MIYIEYIMSIKLSMVQFGLKFQVWFEITTQSYNTTHNGKISAQPHTIVKQICFPNGNLLFLSLFSLSKNWMHNVVWGCAEIFTPVPSWFIKQVVPSLIFHLLLMTSNELILCSSEFTPNWTTNMWGLFWPDSLMVMVTPLKGTNFGGSRKSPIPVLLNLGGPVSLFSSNNDTKERG